MDKFVCVRLVQANALDLALFQFDYDLTFAVFFLNADKTIYGRFGSRSDRKDAAKDISLDGFRKALTAALDLHKHYPANKASLAGKQPRSSRFKTPEDFPSLTGKPVSPPFGFVQLLLRKFEMACGLVAARDCKNATYSSMSRCNCSSDS